MPRKWFALSLQAGREDKIKENLEKRIKSQGLEALFGKNEAGELQMIIPTEKIQEIRGGKRRERERRVHSGYLYMEVEVVDTGDPDMRWQMAPEAYFIVKDTPGVGNFVGTKSNDGRRSVIRPTPMSIDDVRRILRIEEETAGEEGAKVEIDLNKGDHVRIKEGPFENFDGVVEEVLPNKRTVRVTVQLLGRATPVEVEVWQVTAVS